MRISRNHIYVCTLACLFACAPAFTGTLTGSVRNGTNGAAVPNQDVILIQLQAGMEPIGTFKTDGQGHFKIDHPSIGQGPILVRVPYRGVNFHANVPPGQASADVEVFESTKSPAALEVATRLIAMQPNGPALLVAEEFSVHNHSKPPIAVFDEQGNFEFQIPEGGEIGQVTAAGPAGMPLVVGTIERGKGRYAIAFAFRPGESSIRLSYQLPYPTNQATVRMQSAYTIKNVLVAVPPSMQLQGEGLVARGTEQGWNIFGRPDVAGNVPVVVSISGTAPAPDTSSTGQMAADAAQTGDIIVAPQRLENFKWILVAGFGAIFAMGAIHLWKRPVPQMAGSISPAISPAVESKAQAVTNRAAGYTAVEQVLADVKHEARQRLEEVKELLVRIEMRKQAGTISEEEYTRERARTEQMLREYLR